MIDHLTIDRGRIVEPRHLHLVPSWPDETDTDRHYADDGNPIAAAFWAVMLSGSIGFLAWAVFL